MEDDADELTDSDFEKYAARAYDKTDNGKSSVLPLSKFVYLIGVLGKGFNSEDLARHLRKVELNESGSLDRFAFVR